MLNTIATCVTAVGVVIAILGLRASRRQRLRQFETFYVERYWKLMDGLSLPALRGQADGPITECDDRVALAYLHLCEDQLEVRSQGWISDSTWAAWREGMQQHLEKWPFKPIWQEISSAQQGQFELLREFSNNPSADPCKMNWPRRRLAGLGGSTSI